MFCARPLLIQRCAGGMNMDKEAIEQKAAEFVNKNYKKAVELAKKNQEISILSLQKTYKVSYTQATALFNKLIEENVISKTSDKKAKSNVFVEPKTTTDKKPTATKKANAKPATTVKKTAKAADKKKTEKQDPAYAKAVEFVKSNKEFNYGLFQETMQTNKTQTDSLLDQLINDNVVSFTKKGQKPIYKAKEAEKKSTKQNSKPKKVKKEVVQEEPQNKGAYIFDQSKKYKYNIGRNLLVEIVNNEEKEIPLNQLLGWTIIPGIGIQPPTTQTRDGDNILILSDGDMLNLDHNRVIDGDSKNEKKLYENKSGHYLVENDNGKDLVVHNTDYGDVTFHKENDHYNCHRCSDGKRIDSDLITENFIEKIIKTTKENLANNIVSGGANEETKENGETAAETQQNNIAAENKEEINVAEPTIQKEEQENVQEEEKVPEEPAVEKAEENKEEKKDDKPKHDPKKASAFWDTLCGSCMYSATFCAIGSLLGLGVVTFPLMIAFACLAMVFKGFSFQGGFGLVADKPVFDDIATNEPVNEKTKDKDLSRSQNKYLDRKNEIETNKNRIATLNNEIADLNQQIENSKIEEKNHIADLEAQLVEVNENEQTEEFEKPEILEETNEDSKDKKKYKKPTISIKKDKKAKKNAAVKAIKANLVSEHNVDIDEFKKNEQEIERLKAIPEKDLTKADKINLRNAEAYEKKVKEELGKQKFKRQEDEFVESMLKQYEETHGKNELKKNKNIIIEQAKRNFRAGGAKKLASRLHRISEEQMTKFKEEVDKISALETEADTFAETSIYEEIKEKDTDKKTKKTTKKKANEPIVEKEPVKEELSNTTNEQVVAEQTKEEKKEEQVSKKPVEKAEIKEEPKVEQAKEETLAEKPAEEKTPEQKVRDFLSQKADLEKEQQSFENSARHKNFAHFDSIIQTNTKAMEEYNNAKHLLEMNNSPINQNLVKTCENNIKETEKRFKMGVVKVYGTLAQQGEIQKQYPGKTPDQIAFELYKKDRQTFDQEKANISNKSKNLDLQEQDLRKEIKKFDKTVKNVQKLDSKQKPVEATKPVEKVETKKVEEEIKQEATSGKPVEKIVEDAAKKQAVIEKESKKQEEVAQKEVEKKQILENKLNAEAKINEQKELAEKERQKQEKEYVEEFIKQIKKDQGKDFVKTNNEKLIELAKESFKNGTGLSNKKLGKLSKEEIEKTVNKINYHESEAVVEPYESSAADDYSQEYADMSDFNQQVQEVAQVKDHIAELHEEPESANNSDFFEKVNAKKQEPKKQNENINPFEGESVYGDGENPFDKISNDAYDDEMKKDDEINKIIDKSNKTFDELQKKNKTKKETGKNK